MSEPQILARFQQKRPPVPVSAERYQTPRFTKVMEHPSSFIEGLFWETSHFFCPFCGVELDIEHGDRIKCACGLIMEVYGIGLTIWREDE